MILLYIKYFHQQLLR